MVVIYRRAFLLLGAVCVASWAACGPDRDPGASARYLLDQTATLALEVAYETGAEPYAGTYQGLRTWQIAEENIRAIYEIRGRGVDLYVPDELSFMTEIPPQARSTWSQSELRELERKYRHSRSQGGAGRIFILYINGYYRDPKTQKAATQVMAVTLSNSTVVVVFKPVILSVAGAYSGMALRWIEQSTVVHELGHVIGLVDNGVPRASGLHDNYSSSANSDAAATGHCENPDCVMYWAHEGLSSLMNMTTRARTTGSYLLFGQECLEDLQRFQ